VLILTGAFNMVDLFARHFELGSIWTGLVFAATLGLAATVINLPFSVYETFVIEEKYGFNKTTAKTFILDLIKSVILAVILGGLILAAILWFFEKTGPLAWIYCWLAVTVFEIFLLFIAPYVIMPLFNKFIPLEDGDLKTAVENYVKTQNFKMKGLFKMDGSKRSAKTNAFFTGFGKARRIVLFDTLIAKHTVPELVSIVGHEMGHYKKKHIPAAIVRAIATSGLMFCLLSLFIGNRRLFDAFKMQHISIYAGLFFFSFLYTPIATVFGITENWTSRQHEYEADAYAVETTGDPAAMISTLKKLTVDNLSNLTPHPLKVVLAYSHPPVLDRIRAIRAATLLLADFETDPAAQGWVFKAPEDQPASGMWTNAAAAPGKKCITAKNGAWTSPAFAVEPFCYYRLQFSSIAAGKTYWVADFFAADGKPLISDHYSSFDESGDWTNNVFCFRGREGAATARVSFRPIDGKEMSVDDVRIQRISRRQAADWADKVYNSIPPVAFAADAGRWKLLLRTMRALQAGGALRVVMLGDSIVNDTANSAFDVRVERLYPGAKLNIIASVRGGTGCQYYKDANRVKEYVLDLRPDLLIIGGISNSDAESVRSVIHQVRDKMNPEILVMTGAVGSIDPRRNPGWKPVVSPDGTDYRSSLMRMALEERVEFLDMEGAWGQYIAGSEKPWEFFTRDALHANERGRQVLATIMERYLAP
jgi:STE24 endopeptidase